VWKGHRLMNKRYARDNRLITLQSPYRRSGLAPQSGLHSGNVVGMHLAVCGNLCPQAVPLYETGWYVVKG
jgi:hypothetical protein